MHIALNRDIAPHPEPSLPPSLPHLAPEDGNNSWWPRFIQCVRERLVWKGSLFYLLVNSNKSFILSLEQIEQLNFTVTLFLPIFFIVTDDDCDNLSDFRWFFGFVTKFFHILLQIATLCLLQMTT